ncbi:MAG: GNAT family N-acetyltransferase [Clostridia bacterium]|nr:GNAT family N-acetyltransferase [Clostridia bacterium]
MDKNTLARCEVNLFAHCANKINTAFGVLYYNDNNPTSHDANHAHITDLSRADGALELIEAFYVSHGLTPRLFFSGIDGEREALQPLLDARGWRIEVAQDRRVMVLGEFAPPPRLPDGFDVIQMPQLDDELYALFVENDDGGEWCAKAAQDGIASGALTVFAARENGVKVGSVGIDRDAESGLLLVQDVFISPRFRGKGYSGPMVAQAISSIRQRYDGEIYLWVENPIAAHVYAKLGFAEAPFVLTDWNAYKTF